VVAADSPNYARSLGIEKDQVVQELGWDEDTNDNLRADIEEAIGSELLDEDSDEVMDVVLLWWRDGDGDLVDALMEVTSLLSDEGFVRGTSIPAKSLNQHHRPVSHKPPQSASEIGQAVGWYSRRRPRSSADRSFAMVSPGGIAPPGVSPTRWRYRDAA
jgi:hypothetical protein